MLFRVLFEKKTIKSCLKKNLTVLAFSCFSAVCTFQKDYIIWMHNLMEGTKMSKDLCGSIINVVGSEQEKSAHIQILASNKKPQFSSNPYETWWKWLPLYIITFTKFHEDWTKNVDFLLMANFWTCAVFSYSDFTFNGNFEEWKSIH